MVLQIYYGTTEAFQIATELVGAIAAIVGVFQQSTREAETTEGASALILPTGYVQYSQQKFRVSRSFEGGLYGGLVGGLVAGLYGGWSYYRFVVAIEDAYPGQIELIRALSGMGPPDLSLLGVAGPMVGFAALAGALVGGLSQVCIQWFRYLLNSRYKNRLLFNDLTGGLAGGLLAGMLIGGAGGVYFGSRHGFPVPHPVELVLWGLPAIIAILLGVLAFDYRGRWLRLAKSFIIALIVGLAILATIAGLLIVTDAYEALATPFTRATIQSQYIGGLFFGLVVGGSLGGILGSTSLVTRLIDLHSERAEPVG